MAKVKNFFSKVGRWFKNHAPSKRRIIQVYAALLTNANIKGFVTGRIYRGGTKNLCTPGLNCYSCPGAVAACPLGALQDSLSKSDTSFPYYILGILGLLGLMFARTICGFFCPVGLGQELLHKIKTPKLKKSRFTRVLSYFKYVLLAVLVIAIPLIYQGVPAFCKYVCPAGTFGGAGGLLINPNNTDFFDMLGYLFSWKFVLLVIFIVGSIFVYRFFCRFFCPLGAIYGFFNKIALMGVKLDEEKCVDCGLCIQTCQMDINHVGDHECINCGACIKVCPTQAISWKGSQIFLHSNMVTAPAAAAESSEKVNLLAVGSNGNTVTAPLAETDATVSTQTAQEAVKEQTVIKPVEEEGKIQPTSTGNAIKAPAMVKVKHPKKGKKYWLEFAAWIAAAVVLITALVYYNFLAPTSSTVASAVGDKCPDFTLTLCESEGSKRDGGYYKKVSSNVIADDTIYIKGTVTVINFWYTDCKPCKEELPYFAKVKEEFGDSILMITVQTDNNSSTQEFIDNTKDETDETKLWRDWGIIFAEEDTSLDTFGMFGGKAAYPRTIIIDSDGIIIYTHDNKVPETELRAKIQEALDK